MKLKSYFLLSASILYSFSAIAQEKYSDIKINIPKESLIHLYEAGVEADHGTYQDESQTFQTTVSTSDLEIIKKLGLKYSIITDDVTKDFLLRNDPQDFFKYEPSRKGMDPYQSQPTSRERLLFQSPKQAISNSIITPLAFNQGSMGGYLTLAQIKLELDSMVMNYPGLVHMDTIGYTYNNRPIWLVKITGDPSSSNKAQCLITGVHHAREAITASSVIFYMQYLLENYLGNARIKELVDNRELYFIPCVNPDGYEYNHQTNPSGGGMHRKNRNPAGATGTTNVGVDPNRNYGYGWGYNNVGSSPTYSSDTYRGTGPFSEKETQAVRDFLRTKHILVAINYHCYGGDVVIPPGVDTMTVSAALASDINYFGAVNSTYNAYVVGTPIQTVGYYTNGGAQDFYLKGDASLRPNCVTGDPEFNCGTFWPVASQIIPICKETFYGSIQTCLMSGSYAKVEDANPLSLTLAADSFRFTAQRIGSIDSSITVSIIPLENIDTVGSPVTIPSIASWRGEAPGAIRYTLVSGLPASTRIRFVWKTVCGGITVLDTVTKYYKPASLFTDDMETGTVTTKWTVSSGWNYTTTAAYKGTKSISESPTGNYANNASLNLTCKTALNLSGATDAYLSFWVKYNAQNGQDKLQVKFSTNGTGNNATFTAFPGQRTVAENVGTLAGVPSYTGTQNTWIHETISLKSLLGQTNVGMRFSFVSNGSTVADGFYIDNIEVAKINGSPILPKMIQNLSGSISGHENILSWLNDGSNGESTLQRSVNGTEFMDLVSLKDVNTYTDKEPQALNYYRLKMTDQKMDISYSNTVILQHNEQPSDVRFTNPVSSTLVIDLNGVENLNTIVIYDLNGSKISELHPDIAAKTISIPVASLIPGSYLFSLIDSKGNAIARKMFIKR